MFPQTIPLKPQYDWFLITVPPYTVVPVYDPFNRTQIQTEAWNIPHARKEDVRKKSFHSDVRGTSGLLQSYVQSTQ